jgi:hypothetical protein
LVQINLSKMNNLKFVLLLLAVVACIGFFKSKETNEAEGTETSINSDDQYFSAWDGSNPEFVSFIKGSMNDPDSFEHVSTGTRDTSDGMIRIQMTYRGKNSFGATMTETKNCTFNKSDRTISNVY